MRECYFCKSNIKEVDWKEADMLKRYTTASAKIAPRRKHAICSKHQRKISRAIKRARIMGLLPFVTR
ncbi:MAG: 30S ribosomal protein S18 [bacterium]|nr:30S ribosomal protein S18 [bacterium]